jgi:hypothetical protein
MAKLYSFDGHPEHRAQLQPWAEKWIANALSCAPMNDDDRAIARDAVAGLYRAAKLEPPPAHRILFVPSPLTAAIACCLASGVWWMREFPGDARTVFRRDVTEGEMMAAIAVAARFAVEHGRANLLGEAPPKVGLRLSPAAAEMARAE